MFEKITPEEAGISSSEISRFIDYLNENILHTHALILIKGDKIFTEAYWKPFHRDFCHRQYSQTKSFVGIAIGLLLDDGKLSLDDKMVDLLPEKIDDINSLSDRLKSQTVRDMLTMCTAGDPEWWFRAEDPDRTHLYFNSRIGDRIPGAIWQYDSSGSQVLSSLVEKLAGKPILEFLNERLFSHMDCFKTAEMLKTPNGDSWGDSAMICTARDMAAFAKLLRDGGRWNGKQLISESYVKEATSAVVSNAEECFTGVFGKGYGYQIWRAPRDGYAFVGLGGQLTVTLPSKDLIFVINSDTQNNPTAYNLIVNGFLSFVADRIGDAPLSESEDYAKLEEKISGLELFSLKSTYPPVLKEKIDNVTYICDENPIGITKFTFKFDGDEGLFMYTNGQGDKVIPFGIDKNVFGKFPQLGYSNDVGRVKTTDGFMYKDAVSLRFTQANKLQMRVQIIDRYFGNMLITFAFKGDDVACRFTPFGEDFLMEYSGDVIAHKA